MRVVKDGWAALRRYTPARVGLGRTGISLPTARHLEILEALALARDAVHAEFAAKELAAELRGVGFKTVECTSAARDRTTYIRRPDLGRRLASESRGALQARRPSTLDLALVVADGLSAVATRLHSTALLVELRSLLSLTAWRLGPAVLVHQGRVAVGDEVAEILKARAVLVLIGERPGLSATDSLGAYVTWAPHVGCRDAERNCVSNIRTAGLSVPDAARALASTLGAAREHQLSGVSLTRTIGAGALPGKGPSTGLPRG